MNEPLLYLAVTVKGHLRVRYPLTVIELSAHLRAAVRSTDEEIPLTRDGERGTVTLRGYPWMPLKQRKWPISRPLWWS